MQEKIIPLLLPYVKKISLVGSFARHTALHFQSPLK